MEPQWHVDRRCYHAAFFLSSSSSSFSTIKRINSSNGLNCFASSPGGTAPGVLSLQYRADHLFDCLLRRLRGLMMSWVWTWGVWRWELGVGRWISHRLPIYLSIYLSIIPLDTVW